MDLPGYDAWKLASPSDHDDPGCVCNAPDCESCTERQEAEDREAWAVDMAIDDAKEREWDR